MNEPLQQRAGKNADPKPYWFQKVAYGARTSYDLSQVGGAQLLIPGPAYPGSGSKNEPGRAQDTAGQADLGNERYMGARSRLATTPLADSFGTVYCTSGSLEGDVVLVRNDGKAIVIGTLGPVAAGASAPVLYTIPAPPTPPALGPAWCLSPGEDIVFVPNTGTGGSSDGTGVFLPSYYDTDLIAFRQLLTTSKQTVLTVPPGKVWHAIAGFGLEPTTGVPAAGHTLGLLNMNPADAAYTAYLNRGSGADIPFSAGSIATAARFTSLALGGAGGPVFPTEAFSIPAGHSLKLKLDADVSDVYFAAIMAEYNQAEEGDESFANPTIITPA